MYGSAKAEMKVAVDILVYREDGAILFVERKFEPFKGQLALPGGFMEEDETVAHAAARELREETAVELSEDAVYQIGFYDHPKRDPRGRVLSLACCARVPEGTQAIAGDDAAAARFYLPEDIDDIHALAFDHAHIVYDAMNMMLHGRW